MASGPTRTGPSADLIVVGGGVIGLSCAWRAAQTGLDVLLLERDRPGGGASNVAAGMLAPVGEATFGEERLLDLALASHELWPTFASELQADAGEEIGYLPLGALHVALDRDEAAELHRRHELMSSLDLEADWLRPRACRELEPGLNPALTGGVHAPHEAAVDPRLMTAALVAATDASGGRIERAEVDGLIVAAGRVAGVRLADGGERRARRVLLATGSWSAAEWVPPQARPAIRPVKGQILTLRGAAGAVCERIVVSERVYMVPRTDGRLVVGATVEELGFDTRITAGGVLELLREAYRALPEVAELELVESIAGLRPATPDNLPLIGTGTIEGLLLATGHFRNGILLAPITAQRIAAALAADQPAGAEAVAR